MNLMRLKTPVLYILMRTDMQSMNPGKAMAQAAHAANAAVAYANSIDDEGVKYLLSEWQNSTRQSFGTTIVLDAGSINDITAWYDSFEKDADDEPAVFGIVNDPTYPVRDGDVVHFVDVDTCAYLLCFKEGNVAETVAGFPLHA